MLVKNNARAVALATLMQVFGASAYSNLRLNQELAAAPLSPADDKLATRLVYGTIQYKLFLSYQLRGLVRTKLTESYLEPLLLMSLYQLIFLDKVPAHAVLNEANNLAKQAGKHHSSGYRIVNGILRSFKRRGVILPAEQDLEAYLSIKESMPRWLVGYFKAHWGMARTEKLLASLNQPAKNSIRVSRQADRGQVFAKLTALGYAPQASALATDGVILAHGGIVNTALFKAGQVTAQDEAASLVVDAFDFDGTETVLDACSAPGGKTVQIAERLTTDGHVLALDLHPKKLRLVQANAKRLGVAAKVKTQACDARQADEFFSDQLFAKILVDAPCSGLGLLRRKPEIRYHTNPQDLTNLAAIQLDILNQVSQLLAVGGELVYSTCSISVEENEQVLDQFLQTHPQFELKPFQAGHLTSTDGKLKILPDTNQCDGFFISKMTLRG